jgi:ABC-type polysaccharide/polyol phosphate export permease
MLVSESNNVQISFHHNYILHESCVLSETKETYNNILIIIYIFIYVCVCVCVCVFFSYLDFKHKPVPKVAP